MIYNKSWNKHLLHEEQLIFVDLMRYSQTRALRQLQLAKVFACAALALLDGLQRCNLFLFVMHWEALSQKRAMVGE